MFRRLRRDELSRRIQITKAAALTNITSQTQSSDACCGAIAAGCGTSCTVLVCCSLPLPVVPVAVVEGDDELVPLAVVEGDDEVPVVVDCPTE